MASENNSLVLGETIATMCGTYKLQSLLGEGAFGKVVKCVRQADNKMVAMKVLKKHKNYHYQAEKEVEALLKLKDLDVDGCNLVQFYSSFMHKDFYCLVFEYLEQSLKDFMKAREFAPLPLSSVRVIAQQLATALQALRDVGITHTDIKLDNVMMVNHREQPFKVKLIDFGLATNCSNIPKGANIQPLCYRSPEVFLGLYVTEAVDMWALGILCARLCLGVRLFEGKNEYEMLRSIVTAQGMPPVAMLRAGLRTQLFFNKLGNSSWELKTPTQYHSDGHVKTGKTRVTLVPKPLEDTFNVYSVAEPERSERILFVDMLKKMLHLNPTLRIKPKHLLRHKFIIGTNHYDTESPGCAVVQLETFLQATTNNITCEPELKTFRRSVIPKVKKETQTKLTSDKKRKLKKKIQDDDRNGHQPAKYLNKRCASEKTQKKQTRKPNRVKRKGVDAEDEGRKDLFIWPHPSFKYDGGDHQAKHVNRGCRYHFRERQQAQAKPKPAKKKFVDAERGAKRRKPSPKHSSTKSKMAGTKDKRKCRKGPCRKKTEKHLKTPPDCLPPHPHRLCQSTYVLPKI